MRRIVTLVLMMLISGYGAAQAQTQPPPGTSSETGDQVENQAEDRDEEEEEQEEPTEMETATRDFMGLKWGLGIGVMGTFGGDTAVESASIGSDNIIRVDEEGELRPQMLIEMHAFIMGKKSRCWREYQQTMAVWRERRQLPVTGKGEKSTCPDWDGEQTAGNQAPPMPEPPLMGFGPFIALQGSEDDVVDALAVGLMWGVRKDPTDSLSVNIGVGLSFDPSVQVLAKGFKEGDSPPTGQTAVRFKKESRLGWALMASFTF